MNASMRAQKMAYENNKLEKRLLRISVLLNHFHAAACFAACGDLLFS